MKRLNVWWHIIEVQVTSSGNIAPEQKYLKIHQATKETWSFHHSSFLFPASCDAIPRLLWPHVDHESDVLTSVGPGTGGWGGPWARKMEIFPITMEMENDYIWKVATTYFSLPWLREEGKVKQKKGGVNPSETRTKDLGYFPWNTGCLMTGSFVVSEIIPI